MGRHRQRDDEPWRLRPRVRRARASETAEPGCAGGAAGGDAAAKPRAMTRRCRVCLAAMICVACWSCRRGQNSGPAGDATYAASGAPWFEDIAERAGLRFTHQSGHRDRFLLPEIMGGGVALFDMDGDGDLDVYLVQSGGAGLWRPASAGPSEPTQGNRLFRNRGDGTFEDVTAGSGAEGRGDYGMGVAAGDFDNDGDIDLYITNYGPNLLLKNDGRGHFTDVTARAGVAGSSWLASGSSRDPASAGRGWSTSAAFVDYDGDGWLDLFVTHYLDWRPAAEVECYSLTGVPDYCSPRTYDLPSAATLYHNNRDGTFTDVSDRAGLRASVGN